MNWHPISEQVWDGIRAEFTLPAVGQVHQRLSEIMEDPEPVMQQLVRVFIGEGTYCPGFQFLVGGQVRPTVRDLFIRAMALKIPHNCFAAWMVSPSKPLAGSRPVDLLEAVQPPLFRALEAFSQQHAGTVGSSDARPHRGS
ncbi:hypothetical protein [Arthrobacter sp. R4-81]